MALPGLGFRAKLLAIAGLMALAFVLSVAVGNLVAARAERELFALQQRYLPRSELAPALNRQLERMGRAFQDAVATRDLAALPATHELVAELEQRLGALRPETLGLADAAELRAAVEAYHAAGEEVSRRLISGETGERLVVDMEDMQSKQARASALIGQLVAVDRHDLAGAFAAAQASARAAATYQLWISMASLIVVSLLALWVGNGLVRAQQELTLGFQRFGGGDFRKPILVVADDELGAVARSANLMAANLERSEAELKAANHELEAFSYSVAHDLRAPLRGIHGFSRVLLEDKAARLDDEGRDYLQRITANAERMGQLIDALLGLARVSRTELVRRAVNLTELAEASMKQAQSSQPTGSVDFVDQPGLVASGDPLLLRVLFDNLLGNAVKFAGGRSPAHIEFGAERGPAGTVYHVRDDGAGFDMAYADKLFAPFQRLHKASEFPGTGIGLATVQRIVRLHGGRIWAEGAVGRGATFYFTLPNAPGGPDA
jgi:signal transduction histidine kinase